MRLALLFVLLQAGDLVSTWLVFGGECRPGWEGNPVAALVLCRLGWPGLAAFKGVGTVYVVGIAGLIRPNSPRHASGLLWLACLIVGLVCAHNAAALLWCRR